MYATTEKERINQIAAYAIAAVFIYLVAQVVRPFLVPLAWAAALAVCFDPVYQSVERRTGRNAGAVLTTILVALAIIVPVLAIAAIFVRQASEVIASLPPADAQRATAQEWLHTALQRIPGGDSIDLGGILTESLKRAAALLSEQAAGVLQNTVGLVVDVGITLFALFFFFRDGPTVLAGVRRAMPLDEDLRERLIRQTSAIVTSSVRSGVIVAVAQGTLCGLAFWAVGLPSPLFWGVVTTLACVLPLGAWVVWVPAAMWLAASGHVGRGVILVALGAGIVSGVDNVLRPLVMSEDTDMNGLLLLVSLLGGAAAFGSVGLVAGPVVVGAAIVLFEAFTKPAPR
jgi:predicted PurR-regulated permease PerM